MLYPPVADMLKYVDSRYLLVNVVAHRARQIAAEADAAVHHIWEQGARSAVLKVWSSEDLQYPHHQGTC